MKLSTLHETKEFDNDNCFLRDADAQLDEKIQQAITKLQKQIQDDIEFFSGFPALHNKILFLKFLKDVTEYIEMYGIQGGC